MKRNVNGVVCKLRQVGGSEVVSAVAVSALLELSHFDLASIISELLNRSPKFGVHFKDFKGVTFMDEKGFYMVATEVRHPKADKFKSDVFDLATEASASKAPTNMVEALELALTQAKQLESQALQIEMMRPSHELVNTIQMQATNIPMTDFAGLCDKQAEGGIKVSVQKAYTALRGLGYVYSKKTNTPTKPMQSAIDSKLLTSKYETLQNGKVVVSSQVTPKGIAYLVPRVLKHLGHKDV